MFDANATWCPLTLVRTFQQRHFDRYNKLVVCAVIVLMGPPAHAILSHRSEDTRVQVPQAGKAINRLGGLNTLRPSPMLTPAVWEGIFHSHAPRRLAPGFAIGEAEGTPPIEIGALHVGLVGTAACLILTVQHLEGIGRWGCGGARGASAGFARHSCCDSRISKHCGGGPGRRWRWCEARATLRVR